MFEMEYDYLIIACGKTNRTCNTPGLSETNHVYFLKSLSDAKKIRTRMLDCFERAANPDLALEEKKRLLNFIIVGGSSTGIEIKFVSELDDFIKVDVKRWYPELVDLSTVSLIDSWNKIMLFYSSDIQNHVEDEFKKKDIRIINKTYVKGIRRNSKNETEVELSNGEVQKYGMMVWSTGDKPLSFI